MPPNLRSVIERVTRGGRSVVSSRNFSSSPKCGNDSKEAAWLDTWLETRSKSPNLTRCFAFGFFCYGVLRLYKFSPEEKMYQRLREEQVLNAGQDDSKS